jgi:GT2 family glycosyltransferase
VVIGPMLPPPAEWHRPPWVRWHEGTLLEQYRAMENAEWACSWRQFYSANVSMRRACFTELGGFDTTFRRSEDTDLADRLARKGFRFLYSPKAGIEHYAEHGFEAWRASAYQYGQYEVIMARDKGLLTLDGNTEDFHYRHPLTRWVTVGCVGRPTLQRWASGAFEAVMRTAEYLGLDRPARLAASAIFSLMYWQGVCDELGGRAVFLPFLAAHRPSAVELQATNASDQSAGLVG